MVPDHVLRSCAESVRKLAEEFRIQRKRDPRLGRETSANGDAELGPCKKIRQSQEMTEILFLLLLQTDELRWFQQISVRKIQKIPKWIIPRKKIVYTDFRHNSKIRGL